MQDSSFKRVKHKQFPGDVGKREKVAMRGKSLRNLARTQRNKVWPITPELAKGYQKDVNVRTRAVNRERSKKEIAIQLEERDYNE